MATVTTPTTSTFPDDWSFADLQQHLGGISAERIRVSPQPGRAAEADLIHVNDRKVGICELIDDVLVEKTMGTFESELASFIIFFFHDFLRDKNLGIVLGEAGELQILSYQVRVPNVAFIAWERFPDGKRPNKAVYDVAPDLAVEVLSKSNTKAEMDRKLRDYFEAGTRLVWYLDPKARTMRVYTSVNLCETVNESGVVTGGDVLPGFEMSLGELFERAERSAPPEKP